MAIGDTVSVSRYHGSMTGTVTAVRPGYITVTDGRGHYETVDLSRRTITPAK